MNISGIYKLKSPNGKIYIGQSWDIYDRWSDYKKLRKSSIGRRLYNSLRKYKPENFLFEIIHELPLDCSQITMDNYETLYWSQYVDLGFTMLNSRECGGSSGKHSEETKKLMSLASLGIPKSDIHKEALRQSKLVKPTRYWKNKSFNVDHKRKLSDAAKNRTDRKTGPNIKLKEFGKKKFLVELDNVKTEYVMSKVDLTKIFKMSITTLNKLLVGKDCKKLKTKIKICQLNS